MTNLPTLQQLYTGILSDLESEFNITIPLIGKNFLRALAAVQAAKLKLYYLLVADVQKNIFVDTADSVAQGGTLERFGYVKIKRGPFPATAGYYTVSVIGDSGAVIPQNTTFKSDDNSLNPSNLFVLDTAYTLTGTNDTILLRSLSSGLGVKLSVGDTLTSTAPIALVESQVTVTIEDVEPQAAETIEDYRAVVIQSYRLEPQGGAQSDYRLWASEVQGVRQSYPYTDIISINEVNLYVEATIVASTDGKGTPTTQIMDNVRDAIEQPTPSRPSRLPLTATLNVLPITPLDVDIEIAGFQGTPSAVISPTIENSLDNVRPFMGGIDVLANRNDVFSVNKIINLVLQAQPGSQFGQVTLIVDGVNVNSFTFTDGNIPYFNSLTFV